jgi:hypothetical protein
VVVGDELDELFADAEFAVAFADRGNAGRATQALYASRSLVNAAAANSSNLEGPLGVKIAGTS